MATSAKCKIRVGNSDVVFPNWLKNGVNYIQYASVSLANLNGPTGKMNCNQPVKTMLNVNNVARQWQK